ncbi:hypothetical protein [Natronobeatus ordinarius]|uniref:hypothetical protein n=1 Tax=Natronobeatus ordinarius TaxID=2963433 RepID=UPI0020CC1224|nr:hypothetical protein [Natronobeatus ordinarius]
MQDHTPLQNDSLSPSSPETDHQSGARLRRFARSLKGPVQFVSFWAAIALPFLHVPLLAGGLNGLNVTLAFLGLLVANLLALYVGHGYNQP